MSYHRSESACLAWLKMKFGGLVFKLGNSAPADFIVLELSNELTPFSNDNRFKVFFVEAKATRQATYAVFAGSRRRKQFERLKRESERLQIPAFLWIERVVKHERVVDFIELGDAEKYRCIRNGRA